MAGAAPATIVMPAVRVITNAGKSWRIDSLLPKGFKGAVSPDYDDIGTVWYLRPTRE
jgi:hypothetical protein